MNEDERGDAIRGIPKLRLLVRESWTKGSSGVRPIIYWAGLMGCEDMKAEDRTRVRIGLYLAWKASLATNYEDSFLCNRLHVTLDPPGVYINQRG